LFLLGTGVVGGTLLKIIKDQASKLFERQLFNLQVCGIANIESMLIRPDGIELNNWQKTLEKKGLNIDLDSYCQQAMDLNLKHSVFIDCTASDQTSEWYPRFLKAGIHVVTPNKKANTQEMAVYKKLHKSASSRGVKFRYETNVGAGLPVIQTIQDLISAGDNIHKIEGILSGTLSYIFNNYTSKDSFSAIVKNARDKGYTEPDPREDLNGMDVARKILILSREMGWELNITDVDVENLSPVESMKAKNIENYFELLQKYDDQMRDRIGKIEKSGNRLRYIARAEGGKLSAGLKEVDSEHPFYGLQGSDNIVAIYSDYYPIPLVIRGAGAGAEVTAAGVFADILKTISG
jgi:aspartokinase/homoserine dehydrogenase 1